MNRPELTLVEYFQSIQDYRENHNKQHLLIDIIVVAVCCVICGADNFVEIQTIANEKIDWLRTFLSLQIAGFLKIAFPTYQCFPPVAAAHAQAGGRNR